MTTLAQRKTRLRFETDSLVRSRALIVEPEPLVCHIRQKGRRHSYTISWVTIYEHAAQIAARKMREEREELRRTKAKARQEQRKWWKNHSKMRGKHNG